VEKTIGIRLELEVNEDEIWDVITFLNSQARQEDAAELEEVWFEVWGRDQR
jgi:hypothetical protein